MGQIIKLGLDLQLGFGGIIARSRVCALRACVRVCVRARPRVCPLARVLACVPACVRDAVAVVAWRCGGGCPRCPCPRPLAVAVCR